MGKNIAGCAESRRGSSCVTCGAKLALCLIWSEEGTTVIVGVRAAFIGVEALGRDVLVCRPWSSSRNIPVAPITDSCKKSCARNFWPMLQSNGFAACASCPFGGFRTSMGDIASAFSDILRASCASRKCVRPSAIREMASPVSWCISALSISTNIMCAASTLSMTLGRPLGISGIGDCPPPDPLTTDPVALRLSEFFDQLTILGRQILSSNQLTDSKIDMYTDRLIALWDTMPDSLQFNKTWIKEETEIPEWPMETRATSKIKQLRLRPACH